VTRRSGRKVDLRPHMRSEDSGGWGKGAAGATGSAAANLEGRIASEGWQLSRRRVRPRAGGGQVGGCMVHQLWTSFLPPYIILGMCPCVATVVKKLYET
jgi:hypothetical protein